MGRQGGNSMAAGGGGGGGGGASSIALLQERFRQLERMREKREEMELLKLFPGPGQGQSQSQTNRYEPPVRSTVHPRPCLQDSLTLGLDIYKTEPQKKPAKKKPFMEFLSVDSRSKHEVVDTSLHL